MIVNDIKASFQKGSMLTRLIYINLFLFVAIEVIKVVLFLFNLTSVNINDFIGLPAHFQTLLYKPWTILTYMFVHNGFIHLIVNILWLFFGGRIFLKYLSHKQLVSTYVLGGLVGGMFFILSYNFFPVFEPSLPVSVALGSSASVLAILVGIASYVPNYHVDLTFIGRVKLKYIAILTVVLDLILIPKGNSGGHIAHLGGAFYGYFFASQLKRGNDFSKGFDSFMDWLVSQFNNEPTMKTVYKRPKTDDQWRESKAQQQNDINLILDKIAKSGYDSLNKKEKDTLFKESKK